MINKIGKFKVAFIAILVLYYGFIIYITEDMKNDPIGFGLVCILITMMFADLVLWLIVLSAEVNILLRILAGIAASILLIIASA